MKYKISTLCMTPSVRKAVLYLCGCMEIMKSRKYLAVALNNELTVMFFVQ